MDDIRLTASRTRAATRTTFRTSPTTGNASSVQDPSNSAIIDLHPEPTCVAHVAWSIPVQPIDAESICINAQAHRIRDADIAHAVIAVPL
ncbi:hypothetical protein BTO02_16980 [Paraburkholderia sp. SOS3]|nr:hypothetical protein BTO02_16980 [Paraburkholderia sp. SOS3]